MRALVQTPARGLVGNARVLFLDELVRDVRDLPGVSAVSRLAQHSAHRIELADAAALQAVLSLLVSNGVRSIRTSRPNLDEVYVHLIGDRGLRVCASLEPCCGITMVYSSTRRDFTSKRHARRWQRSR